MIPSPLIPALASAADSALNNVLRTGALSWGQRQPTGEVGFVAAAVLGGVPDIAAAWQPILQKAGFGVTLSGVFCHQSPQATFTDSAGNLVSCELADLLIVVDDFTGGRQGQRWAVLVQATMAATGGGQSLTSSGDLRQLDLLSRWPPFTLPAGFAAAPRDFASCAYAGATLDCGRYGLIDAQPRPLWHQQAPAATMPPGGPELGTFIARMLETGQVGYGREATGHGDDWSQTVHELMTVTYANMFNYAQGFPGPRPRGHSALVAFADASTPAIRLRWHSGELTPSGGRPEQPRDEAPGEGISLLRIAVHKGHEEHRLG